MKLDVQYLVGIFLGGVLYSAGCRSPAPRNVDEQLLVQLNTVGMQYEVVKCLYWSSSPAILVGGRRGYMLFRLSESEGRRVARLCVAPVDAEIVDIARHGDVSLLLTFDSDRSMLSVVSQHPKSGRWEDHPIHVDVKDRYSTALAGDGSRLYCFVDGRLLLQITGPWHEVAPPSTMSFSNVWAGTPMACGGNALAVVAGMGSTCVPPSQEQPDCVALVRDGRIEWLKPCDPLIWRPVDLTFGADGVLWILYEPRQQGDQFCVHLVGVTLAPDCPASELPVRHLVPPKSSRLPGRALVVDNEGSPIIVDAREVTKFTARGWRTMFRYANCEGRFLRLPFDAMLDRDGLLFIADTRLGVLCFDPENSELQPLELVEWISPSYSQ